MSKELKLCVSMSKEFDVMFGLFVVFWTKKFGEFSLWVCSIL